MGQLLDQILASPLFQIGATGDVAEGLQVANQQMAAQAAQREDMRRAQAREAIRGLSLDDPRLPQVLMDAGLFQEAEFVMKSQARPNPSSTIGKIQADIDAGLIDPEIGAAALKKATMPGIQYMMSPDGEVIAIDKSNGSMVNMGMDGGMPATPPTTQPQMGGLITPPPPGLSPKGRAAWTDKQVTNAAETLESLKSTASKLPQLVETVNKLSELGEKATYSELGKIIDWGAKQAGISTEGSVARTEYGSIVDNQVLPILKDTFGAQFTKAEGDALRATLGDKDTTPEQKNAVLTSFIRQKINDISALGSRAGIDVTPILKAAERLRIGQPAKAMGGWSVEVVQ